jgi:hypothetical protein
MSDATKGWVYIATNPYFKDNCVKIGKTARMPHKRLQGLDSTAMPAPFELFASISTQSFDNLERVVHRHFDKFRIRKNREFFELSPQEALNEFENLADLLPDAEIMRFDRDGSTIPLSQTAPLPKQTKKRRQCFAERGIKNGSTIAYKDDPTITAVVSDENSWGVSYNGQSWKLSGLVRHLKELAGIVNSFDGKMYFTYDGKVIGNIPVVG